MLCCDKIKDVTIICPLLSRVQLSTIYFSTGHAGGMLHVEITDRELRFAHNVSLQTSNSKPKLCKIPVRCFRVSNKSWKILIVF